MKNALIHKIYKKISAILVFALGLLCFIIFAKKLNNVIFRRIIYSGLVATSALFLVVINIVIGFPIEKIGSLPLLIKDVIINVMEIIPRSNPAAINL